MLVAPSYNVDSLLGAGDATTVSVDSTHGTKLRAGRCDGGTKTVDQIWLGERVLQYCTASSCAFQNDGRCNEDTIRQKRLL